MKHTIIFFLLTFLFLFSCKKDANNLQNSNFTVELHDFTDKPIEDFYKDKNFSLIVVNFWATFCGPCKKEMPDLAKIYTEYKEKGVLIIGASVDDASKKGEIEKLTKILHITYPILYGLPQKFKNEEIAGFPTTYFLNSDLTIKDKVIGHRDYNFFKSKIESFIENTTTNIIKKENILNIKEEYFSIEHSITKKENNSFDLTITLYPNNDYHLSGENYPPISLSLSSEQNITIKPNFLTIQGIETRQSQTWKVTIEKNDNKLRVVKIKARIKLVACTNESCNIVDKEVVFDIDLE